MKKVLVTTAQISQVSALGSGEGTGERARTAVTGRLGGEAEASTREHIPTGPQLGPSETVAKPRDAAPVTQLCPSAGPLLPRSFQAASTQGAEETQTESVPHRTGRC